MTEPTRDSEDLLSLAEIARWLGQSTPSVVTNWRLRYADFPAPSPQSQTEARPRFRRGDVVDWLRSTNRGDLLDGREVAKGRPGSGDLVADVVARLTPPATASIVALGAGTAGWLEAARRVAVSAQTLLVSPESTGSQGSGMETVQAEPSAHYFAGRQFDLVIARVGTEGLAAQRMFDVIERVLPISGTALVVAPASLLEDSANRDVRERLVRFGLLDAVIALGSERASAGRLADRQVLIVVRPDRASEQVLFMERIADDRIAEDYLAWVTDGRRERRAGPPFTRPSATLLTRSMVLTPTRWKRTDVEKDGPEKTVGRLQDELPELRAQAQGFPSAPSALLSARRPSTSTTIRSLQERSLLKLVQPADVLDDAVTIEFTPRAGLIATAVDVLPIRHLRRGIPVRPGDVVVRPGRGGAGVVVFRGEGLVFVDQRAVVLRLEPQSELIPEYLAVVIRGIRTRLETVALDPAELYDVDVPILSLSEQRAAAEQYRALVETVRAAEELATRSSKTADRFGEAVARGFLRLDNAEQS